MKRPFTILLSIAFVAVSVAQEVKLQQYSKVELGKLMFTDNNNFDYKTIGYPNHLQLQRPANNSSIDTKQKLDSLILKMYYEDINTWTRLIKHEFIYDENGNTTILIENTWDNDLNIWIPLSKFEQVFNELNKPLQLIFNSWETDSNQWNTYEKHEYEYDENGNLKLELIIEKDYNNNWVNKWKRDYTYNINFEIQSELRSIWVIDSNMFMLNNIHEFNYNTDGKLATYTEKVWAQNIMTWRTSYESFYTYNNNNQDSSIVSLKLDYATDSLINWSRMEYYYDSNEFDKIDLFYYWDKSLNQWEFESKQEVNYDNNDKNTLLIRSLWNINSTNWQHVEKNEFTYDYNENLSSFQMYIPTDSVDWLLLVEYDYNYDFNYRISECFFPIGESYPPEFYNHMYNKPTDWVGLSVDNGIFYEAFKTIYHYSELNIGISEDYNNEIEVYPNPTTGQLKITNENEIELKEIIIFNQIGQKVFNKSVIPRIIDLSSFYQGIYVIEFITENSLIRKKIIIKK